MSERTPEHGTLAANQIKVVDDPSHYRVAAILNKSSADWIYARADGISPTVSGVGTYAIPPGARRKIPIQTQESKPSSVEMVSTGTPSFEVEFG